ncbi:MAG: hypothetical protein ABSF65_08075 [Candidatus Bathyarchaeia archaeon]
MDRVKFALTILSIMIIVVPLVVEVYVYKDNLEGLVLPPQIKDLMNGGNSKSSGSSTDPQSSASSSLPNFQMPQPVGQPQYDPATGAFNYPFNFTNPLSTQLSLTQLSAQVVTEDGTPIGNISIPQTISIAPGANAIIAVVGNLNTEEVNQLAAQYQSGNLNIALNNVNVVVGGVSIHMDHIDAGSISDLQSLAGNLGGT